MRLFHGLYTEVRFPEVCKGRKMVDFGQGFYLTSIQEQAENWSRVISIRKGPASQPTVSIFELNVKALAAAGFRVRTFQEYNIEWLEYVVDCSRGGVMQQSFDVVEGGVANDNVIDTVEDYENGRITAEQALGQLKYKKVNHQVCILNQQVVQMFLCFIASYKPNKKL